MKLRDLGMLAAALFVAAKGCGNCDETVAGRGHVGESVLPDAGTAGETDAGYYHGHEADAGVAQDCIPLHPGVNVIEQSGVVCPGHYLDQKVQIIVGKDGVGIAGPGVILEQTERLEGPAIEVSDRAGVTIDSFTIRGKYSEGISVWWLGSEGRGFRGNTSVTVRNNIVEGPGGFRDGIKDEPGSYHGILVANIDKTLVTGNMVKGYVFCLQFDGGDYSRVIANTISDCAFGIFAGFINRAGNEIAENTVTQSFNGLYFGGKESTVHHNTMTGNEYIKIEGCDNAIYENDFTGTSGSVDLRPDCNDTRDNRL